MDTANLLILVSPRFRSQSPRDVLAAHAMRSATLVRGFEPPHRWKIRENPSKNGHQGLIFDDFGMLNDFQTQSRQSPNL
jgi:hypothetical protein